MKRFDRLTPRQRQVLEPLLRGQGEKRVAHLLKLSVNTVHFHVRQIYAKYGVHTRGELLFRVLHEMPRPETPDQECAC